MGWHVSSGHPDIFRNSFQPPSKELPTRKLSTLKDAGLPGRVMGTWVFWGRGLCRVDVTGGNAKGRHLHSANIYLASMTRPLFAQPWEDREENERTTELAWSADLWVEDRFHLGPTPKDRPALPGTKTREESELRGKLWD